jgi:4'-phosphopantetheinyl transferase EntD
VLPVPDLVETPHGVLAIVALPEDELALASTLHPEEIALTGPFAPRRVRTFAGGRYALRAAMTAARLDFSGPILRDDRGAPIVPAGVRASLSHGDDVACALVAVGFAGQVGVDIETIARLKPNISRLILTERERAIVKDEPRELALRFSLKESFYKAIDPYVRRYIGFHEVEVDPLEDGTARFVHQVGAFIVDARWVLRGPHVISTVRASSR